MIRFILLGIVLIIALSYFGISIRHIVESPTGQDNFTFVWAFIKDGWSIIVGWLAQFLAAIKNVIS